MTAEQLRQGWSPRRVGRQIRVLSEVPSTNLVALEAAGDPAADGLVVLADHQSAGRGRHGRTWLSPRRASVLCTVLLLVAEQGDPPRSVINSPGTDRERSDEGLESASRPGIRESPGGWLTLASAVAACEAIREVGEVTPAIKWPNDLRVYGRKLGGILVESCPVGARTRAWAVGIGINCLQQEGHFPPELRGQAISLDLAASHPIDRLEVARSLLQRLDSWLIQPPPPGDAALHTAWSGYAEPIGQRVRLLCRGREYRGRTIAVDPSGGLIVQADDGSREWFDPMLTTLM